MLDQTATLAFAAKLDERLNEGIRSLSDADFQKMHATSESIPKDEQTGNGYAIKVSGVGEGVFDAGTMKGVMAAGLGGQITDMLSNNLNASLDKDKTLQTQLRRMFSG